MITGLPPAPIGRTPPSAFWWSGWRDHRLRGPGRWGRFRTFTRTGLAPGLVRRRRSRPLDFLLIPHEDLFLEIPWTAVLARRAIPQFLRAAFRARPLTPLELLFAMRRVAGRLGVAIADALVAAGHIELDSDAGIVSSSGLALFERIGLDVVRFEAEPAAKKRRLLCRPCLDWSERRPHLAGKLGSAICRLSFDKGWIRRVEASRAVMITPKGQRELRDEAARMRALVRAAVAHQIVGDL